jgi:hypothetical protein
MFIHDDYGSIHIYDNVFYFFKVTAKITGFLKE